MRKCDTGRLIIKATRKGSFFVIRLNFVETGSNGKSYHTKDIATHLPATRKNKARAEAMVAEAVLQYSTDEHHMLFVDYCSRWLSGKQPEVERSTYEGYQYRIRRIRDFFESKKLLLTDIQPQHIRDFYHWLLTVDVRKGGDIKQGYSNRTIKDTATLLCEILDDAVSMEILKKNPAGNVKIPHRPAEKVQQGYLDPDQIATFREEIIGHRLETAFLLTLFFGLRREEILGLRWSAVRDGKIFIEHTVTHVKTTTAKDRAKTEAGYRSYPLIPEIAEKLKEIRAKQDFYREQMGKEYQDTDYIFTWEDGHPYSPDYLTKSFKKLVRRSAMLDDSLTLHSLRSSCVSLLIHSGVDIKDTQVWVGHSDIATTMNIYARTNEKQQTAAANTMANAVFA